MPRVTKQEANEVIARRAVVWAREHNQPVTGRSVGEHMAGMEHAGPGTFGYEWARKGDYRAAYRLAVADLRLSDDWHLIGSLFPMRDNVGRDLALGDRVSRASGIWFEPVYALSGTVVSFGRDYVTVRWDEAPRGVTHRAKPGWLCLTQAARTSRSADSPALVRDEAK